MYRVEQDGRAEIVYVAGPPGDRWVFWDGRVFHRPFSDASSRRPTHPDAEARQLLEAPMPATVLKVHAEPGATVRKGDTLVILEAMKMELPIRAAADATVVAVRCREGDLVQPGTVLIELE
jgi:3-methylcrotonyl-CoA carboxylase alpha subunit